MCEVTVHGDNFAGLYKNAFASRNQHCWRGNKCPSSTKREPNRVCFRETRIHGELVIYRWQASGNVLLQNRVYLTTAGGTLRKVQQREYRLCGFTVFHNCNKHYTTHSFVYGKHYICDDAKIRASRHDFAKVVQGCVMAIYERCENIDICKGDTNLRSVVAVGITPDKLLAKKSAAYFSSRLASTTSVQRTAARNRRKWIQVHGDGFCWVYAFLVAAGFLTQIDFPNGDNGNSPPTGKAIELSRALAPHAFHDPRFCSHPRFRGGNLFEVGTYGCVNNFFELMKKIKPAFRFFLLDETRTWIKFAAGSNEPRRPQESLACEPLNRTNPEINLSSQSANNGPFWRYDYEHTQRIQFIQLAADIPTAGAYVLCKNTDVVTCWASSDHFNALSPGCCHPDEAMKSYLQAIANSPHELVTRDRRRNSCKRSGTYFDLVSASDSDSFLES